MVRRQSDFEQLTALLEQAPDGIFVADLDGRYTDVNEAGCRLLGYSRAQIVGKTIADLIPPEQLPRLQAQREQLLTGRILVSDWKLRRKDGSYVPVEVSAKILPDGRWQGFVRDISERERLAEEQRVAQERLRVSLQASPAVVFNQDLELRYTWLNNPRRPFDSETVLGKTDFELFPAVDAEQLMRIKRSVLETGAGAHTIVRATIGPDAFFYDLIVEALRDASGRVIGLTGAAWDVTDQHRAERNQRFLSEAGTVLLSATLHDEEILRELARLAVRELADWFLVDLIGSGGVRRLRVAHSDPAKSDLAQQLERFPLDRERPHLMLEPLRSCRTQLLPVVREADLERLSQSAEHRDLLRALPLRSLISAPLMSRGKLRGAFAFVSSRASRAYGEADARVVEELARVAALALENAQLYEATNRAIAARDEVLGIVAHDLRTPLNTMLLQTELLRRRDGQPERRDQRRIDDIRRAGLRMDRLVQDMLDVARLESGALSIEHRDISTGQLLQAVFHSRREEAARAGLELRLHEPELLPDVLGDHDRLLQVFDNLIGNAIKFTPAGGSISIDAEDGLSEVLFRVTDTGRGMPQHALPHLFDRFWQGQWTDRRGAGLGLAIVKGIVEAHGGRIWAKSEPGKGSTFCFSVPVAAHAQSHMEGPAPA